MKKAIIALLAVMFVSSACFAAEPKTTVPKDEETAATETQPVKTEKAKTEKTKAQPKKATAKKTEKKGGKVSTQTAGPVKK
ncbi:MAG: hypothetical protein PHE61_07710 [Candidatus Omnitrophica bacterium]|nr:hypothetical protein [Candidatus Omnitrophota bacterium]